MSMIRVQIPATCANIGPGLFSTAMALRLHNTVDVSERDVGLKLRVTEGDFASSEAGIAGFVLAALERYFRQIQRAPSGLDIVIDQAIPSESGLGSERAIELACLLGVNLLLGNPLTREELVQFVARSRRESSALVAAVRGGLIGTAVAGDRLIYESLPIQVSRVGIVLPHTRRTRLEFFDEAGLTVRDARAMLRGQTMTLHALASANLDLLSHAFHRVQYHSSIVPFPTEYEPAFAVNQSFRNTAISVSGIGPALIVFSDDRLEEVVEEVRTALRRATQSEVTSWIVPVDTQGVAISEMGGAGSRREAPVPVDELRARVDT